MVGNSLANSAPCWYHALRRRGSRYAVSAMRKKPNVSKCGCRIDPNVKISGIQQWSLFSEANSVFSLIPSPPGPPFPCLTIDKLNVINRTDNPSVFCCIFFFFSVTKGLLSITDVIKGPESVLNYSSFMRTSLFFFSPPTPRSRTIELDNLKVLFPRCASSKHGLFPTALRIAWLKSRSGPRINQS